jgi:hypothetical protein
MLGVLALRERAVLSGVMDGLDERSGSLAVRGGVGMPFAPKPSFERVRDMDVSCDGKGYCCEEWPFREGTGGVSTKGEK